MIDFENTQPYNDGVIFREICLQRGDEDSQKTWMARLAANPSKLRDFRQLLRQQRQLPLLNELKSLCAIEGLWQDFKIGTFHRILTMRCTEVSANARLVAAFTNTHLGTHSLPATYPPNLAIFAGKCLSLC